MTRPIQGINAVTMNDVLSALHGPILGPETAYAAITFKSSTDDATAIYHEFVQHAAALRFADSADTVAARLKQHDPADIDLLVATVSLADATERMHDTIRKLAVTAHEHICSVETKAVLPLEENILMLQTADDATTRSAAWRKLHATIEAHQIIPFLESVNSFLYFAGDRSRKRCVIFGARPDTRPDTEHFQLVREFLHNISNGLLPFTLKTQLLKETLEQLPAEVPEADSFDTAIEDLAGCIRMWCKGYEGGVLTLHRYFIFDLLEKTYRQALDPAVRVLAQAAAAGSPAALNQVRSTLGTRHASRDYAGPLLKQRDKLSALVQRIADWHDKFTVRTRNISGSMSQAQFLIENTLVATSALSKLAEFIPTGNEEPIDQSKVRRFYVHLGRFHAVRKMAIGFEGWNSRREAHMKLPY